MYEHRRMVVWMVGLVVGLVLLGWRMSAIRDTTGAIAELRDDAASAGEIVSGAIGQANQAQSLASAQHGVAVLETLAAQLGGYAGITTEALRALDPSLDPTVVLAYSDAGGYCIQAGENPAVVHSTGAGAVPGPCP